MSVTVQISGLDKLMSQFANLGVQGIRMADAVLATNVDGMVLEAKQSAPADLGTIRQNLGKDKISDGSVIGYNFFCNALEGGFQEFGTGGKVSVPDEMADVASAFQGYRGGDMQAFVLALIGWVRRHGLTNTYSTRVYSIKTRAGTVTSKGSEKELEQMAWGIAKKILRDGLQPQPFFYPAFVNGRSKLMPTLEQAYNELVKSI